MFAGLSALWLFAAPAKAEDKHCPLGKAEPVLNNGTYSYNEKTGISAEHIRLNNKVALNLRQGGCEYMTTIYAFFFKVKPAELNNHEHAKAAEMLTLLEKTSPVKMDFAEEKKALLAYAKQEERKLDTVLSVQTDMAGINQTLWVETGMEGDTARLQVIVSTGPF